MIVVDLANSRLICEGTRSILLYKEKDNINVMKRLKLDVEKGMARYKTKRKGKKVKFKLLQCEKDYMKKRNE